MEEASAVEEYNIRLYSEGDENQIVDLLRIVFPLWKPKSLDHWIWKYISPPIESDIVVAEKDSKIVGIGHRINFACKIGERKQVCTYGDDWGVDPEYRRRGINTRIAGLLDKQRMNKNIAIMYTQMVNPIVVRFSLKRGRLAFPHDITRVIKIKDVNTHLKHRPRKNNVLIRLGLPILKMINKIAGYTIPINKSEIEVKISDVNEVDEAFNDFWDKVRSDYLFTLEKNKEYLDWRLNERGGDYFVKQALQGGELVGFIACELRTRDGYTEVYVLDLVTLSDRSDVAFLLIEEAWNFCENRGINVLYYQGVVGHPYLRVFSKSGFLDSGTSPYVVLDISEDDYEILKKAKPGQVSFTYINTLH
jgi:hypothetical protein